MHYITDYMLVVGIVVLVIIGLAFAWSWFRGEFLQTPSQIADKQSAKLIAQIDKDFERMGRSLEEK